MKTVISAFYETILSAGHLNRVSPISECISPAETEKSHQGLVCAPGFSACGHALDSD